VVELDGQLGRLIPAVAVGFGLQTLAGALTYLLPAVWGRSAHGNRRLTRLLEAGWPLRVAALNLGVAAVTVGSAGSPLAQAGQLLVAFGLGSFVVLAAIALAWRPTGRHGRSGTQAERRPDGAGESGADVARAGGCCKEAMQMSDQTQQPNGSCVSSLRADNPRG
jgi:hypothetical protein